MLIEKIDLESIKTKDVRHGHQNGVFIPVWRDWDKSYEKEPKMVYVTTCFPGELKGPHLHLQRWSYLTVLRGEVVFIVKTEEGFQEHVITADKPQTLVIPAGTPQAHVNIGTEEAIVMNLCNPAWHPDNQDNYSADYGDYDFSKWGYCPKSP
jgi:dTDP-4-dehydrorhamnose 3,5-epimerase-like enzyme